MIKQKIYSDSEVELISDQPLTTLQLSIIADEIRDELTAYRPEFANLAKLHRNIGCRVQELFDKDRWRVLSNYSLQVEPQKGNANRIVQLQDIGYADASEFTSTLADIGRLPKRQYDRAFAQIVKEKALWRIYEDGFAHPSTHFFRHVKIKELAALGFDRGYIATWIGEKNIDNLDYYLDSTYFV